jgi:hypothetical protein
MAFALLYVSPKVETSIRNKYYHLILFLLVCLEGTIFTLFYHEQASILAGATGISFFIMSIFIMLNLNREFMAYRKKPVRIILMISAAALTWISVISLRALLIGIEPAYTELASAGFGIISAALIYTQILFLNHRKRAGLKTRNQMQAIPEPEEYTHAYISGAEQRKYYNREMDDYHIFEHDDELSEDKLNEILDKINEYGKESLSPDEINFLKEYSKSL